MNLRLILWEALVEAYDNFYSLMLINVLWFLVTLPLVTAPAAAAGLYYSTNHLAHHGSFSWRIFFEGFRKHFWLGWRWALVNLFVLVVLAANFIFYGGFEGDWTTLARGGVIWLVILWLLLQLYTFPLLLEQVDRRMLVAVRNSVVLYIKSPGLSLGLIVLFILIAVLSSILWIPWIIISVSLITFLTQKVMLAVLETVPSK